MPLAMASGDSRGVDASRAAPGTQGGDSSPFDANRLKSILSRQQAPAELEIEPSAKSEKMDELAALSDFQISEKIGRYTNLQASLEMKDRNLKLHRQLQLLREEKERREKRRTKDGKHLQPAEDDEARFPSMSSSPPEINKQSFPSSTKFSVFPEAVERVQQNDRTASGQQAGPSCPPPRRTNWACLNSLSRSATTRQCARVARPVVSGYQSTRRLRSAGLKDNGASEAGEVSESDRKAAEPSAIGLSMDNAMELVSSDDEDPGRVPVGPNHVANVRSRRPGLRPLLPSRLDGQTIAYPSRDDPDAIEVPFSDMQRLAPLEFLNDTIIDFYIKYMQKEWKGSKERDEFHFFNTFFYKKLSDIVIGQKPKRGENKESKESKDIKEKEILKLRKWTKGTNIFDKAYLFIPVHDNLHWSLAIICLPPRTWDGLQYDPCIIHLDSMQPGHSSQYIFRALRTYLVAEWKHRDDQHAIEGEVPQIKKLKVSAENFQAKRVPVPQQENESDCGLFLLHYIQRFIEDSPPNIRWSELEELKDKLFGRKWFDPQDASSLRHTIQALLQSLFEAQEKAQENGAQQLVKENAPSKSQEQQVVTVTLDLDIQRTEAAQDDLQLLVDLDAKVLSPQQKSNDDCVGQSQPEVVEC